MGRNNCGSTRTNRASVCASMRSLLRELALINCTCRALATITSKPNPLSIRLNHGECVPTSMAIRQRCSGPNFSTIALRVVATLPSDTTSPCAPSTQYRLVLSPRSMPIVIGPCFWAVARFGLCLTLLFFFMAGLLCTSIGSLSHPVGG
jgi:hypothetical protein